MFISFSKTIARVGGLRIGVGKRITAKNAWWMLLVVCFVAVFKFMWYMCVFILWLVYAMLYGMWWCCKKIIQGVVGLIRVIGSIKASNSNSNSIHSSSIYEKAVTMDPKENKQSRKYCSNCGAEIKDGNAFCSECGTKVE